MASATPAPLDTVVGQSPPVVQTPTAETPRPQQRLTRPGRTDPPAPWQPQGNAQETTRVGRADGAAPGTAAQTQRGDVGQAAEDGRAIARYPQQVLRRLSRIRPPNSEVEAAAVVAFTLTSNGGLAQLFVARSSGSAEFDRLALAYVQRAVPFPAPPIGAQRRFNVTVRSP
nr:MULTISPECIES: TonB family protein [unclassified Roseobacter]